MKKLILFGFALLTAGIMSAQEVGIRLGDGGAIDLVFGTGVGRIHANVGWSLDINDNDSKYNDALYVDVLWDLLYKPLQDNFYWYVGVGGAARIGDPFRLGAAGELGIEYRFSEVPIVLGADWRPTFWLIESTDFSAARFGINARWNFGG